MSDLFIELYSEEIPARLQKTASHILKENILTQLKENYFKYGLTKEYYGSKRLALNIENVSIKQDDIFEEKRGPRSDANIKAIEGFAKSLGVPKSKLVLKETDKGTFFFYAFSRKGKKINKIFPIIIRNLISNFPWIKSQKWGNGSIKWVRPLRNIVVLYDGTIIKCKIGDGKLNIQSVDFSYGHSFLKKEKVYINNHKDYIKTLEKNFVLVDPINRKNKISLQIKKISKKLNLKVIEDDSNLEEVSGLVEWPNALVGKIDKKFMILPREVLMSVMRVHQKYFALENGNKQIQPYFIVISNMPKNTQRDKKIIFGNEKVLRARLEDAKFYWEKDKLKNFSKMLFELKKVTYFDGLGTLYNKSLRIEKIAHFISKKVKLKNSKSIRRAALMCKTDLISGMVGEFPELQGTMGGYYANKEGKYISLLIRDHYLPKASSDSISQDIGTNIISLSDKIDHLTGFFFLGKFPSGSKDPFGLRRSALGIVKILLDNRIYINIDELILFTISLISKKNNILEVKIKSFIIDRFIALMRDKGIKYDIINCYVNDNPKYFCEMYYKIKILENFLKSPSGKDLKSLWLRISNILAPEIKNIKKFNIETILNSNNTSSQEKDLIQRIENVKVTDNFLIMLQERSSLKKVTDKFFENFKINDPIKAVKERRLKILSRLRMKLLEIGNLDYLES